MSNCTTLHIERKASVFIKEITGSYIEKLLQMNKTKFPKPPIPNNTF